MIKPENWKPADRLQLEPNALAAAMERTDSLALTAGPGAGKTEMLAQRADFLLRTSECRYPQRILAISFKVDAAKNLKDRVRKRCGPELASRFDSYTFHAFAKRLIDRFRPVLTGADALDPDYTLGLQRIARKQIEFADLVPFALQVLAKCPPALNAVRQTYSHVFLDEFQDCTQAQYQLIKAAFHRSPALLTAVGDTKQKIMGWAGAMEGVFQIFVADFHAKPLNLYQNFRADLRLRRMQNAMVKVLDAPAAVPDDQLEGDAGTVEVLRFQTSAQEAQKIGSMVQGWIDLGLYEASQIAILVSKQPDAYALELMTEFAKLGVPFRNEQALQDLASEPAARVLVDYLTVVFAERQPDAFVRLIDFLLSDTYDDDEAASALARWQSHIDTQRHSLGIRGRDGAQLAREVGGEFFTALGREALAALSGDYEQGARLEEVIEQTFMRISELASTGSLVDALHKFADDRAVRVMTIHKSKGLEFDAVIVLGVEDQAFWGKPDEERAAYFVAISRAKHALYLTAADMRTRPEGFKGRWSEARTEHAEFIAYAEQTT